MHLVLLQGHSANFFTYLGAEAQRRGHKVTKVNFCAGDDAQWRGAAPIRFKGRIKDLDSFYGDLFRRTAPDAVALYDDRRDVHGPAVGNARALNIPLWVFGEGYFGPDHLTMDHFGYGCHSAIPRDPSQLRILAARLPEPALPRPVGTGKLAWAAQDAGYRVSNALLGFRYPATWGLRQIRVRAACSGWLLKTCRDATRGRNYRRAHQAAEAAKGALFLLPLQHQHDDVLLQCSGFRDMAGALEEVITSFSEHAPAGARLAITRERLDPETRDWRRFIARTAGRLQVADRVLYVAGDAFDALLESACGVVTVNGAAGTRALERGIPVKALGQASYRIAGLVDEQPLREFWRRPQSPDLPLFSAFRRAAYHLTQINGGLYTPQGKALAAAAAVTRLETQQATTKLLPAERKGRILISFGMVKSASTYAFDLAARTLENAGFAQRKLPCESVTERNFLKTLTCHSLADLLREVRGNEFIALKTHQRLSPEVWEMLRRPEVAKRVCIHVIFRDPRDAALSLMDAGAKARKRQGAAFRRITGLPQAFESMQKHVAMCQDWAKCEGSLKLCYDDVAFDTLRTIERMAARFGVACVAEEVRRYVANNASRYLNKGVPRRHLSEMPEEENRRFTAAFGDFIARACEQRDEAWFDLQEFSWLSETRRAPREKYSRKSGTRERTASPRPAKGFNVIKSMLSRVSRARSYSGA